MTPERPKVGTVCQAAAWYHNLIAKDAAKTMVRSAFRQTEENEGVVFGPIVWGQMDPLDAGVPAPPENVKGDVGILRGEAAVIVVMPERLSAGFSRDLPTRELDVMRQVTRDAHSKARPEAELLTDMQCDVVIDEIAPVTAESIIREAVDSGQVN